MQAIQKQHKCKWVPCNVALSHFNNITVLYLFYIVSICYSLEAADKPLLHDLTNHMKTTKWYRLGLELDTDSHSLDIIEHDASRVEDRLRMVFQQWLKVCKKPSWKEAVKALRAIDEVALATELEGTFCI